MIIYYVLAAHKCNECVCYICRHAHTHTHSAYGLVAFAYSDGMSPLWQNVTATAAAAATHRTKQHAAERAEPNGQHNQNETQRRQSAAPNRRERLTHTRNMARANINVTGGKRKSSTLESTPLLWQVVVVVVDVDVVVVIVVFCVRVCRSHRHAGEQANGANARYI